VHFFQCGTCQSLFPGIAFKSCRYHPENPRFLVDIINEPSKNAESTKLPATESELTNSRQNQSEASADSPSPEKEYTYKPYGKYPCCKTTTYKYLTTPNFSVSQCLLLIYTICQCKNVISSC
jgi:hypothetical protein